MSDNDYAARQAEKDRDYQRSYNTPEAIKWIESLSTEERQRLELQGLLKPMLDRSGSTLRDEDASESKLAAEQPDIATVIDQGSPSSAAEPLTCVAGDVLASFCARMRSCAKPALVFDAVCYATGVLAIEGQSATELAAKHGVTKQAFSKIAVEWCTKFGLHPARSMKSKRARSAYRNRAKAVHQRHKLTIAS
jgi:hypothetical protein